MRGGTMARTTKPANQDTATPSKPRISTRSTELRLPHGSKSLKGELAVAPPTHSLPSLNPLAPPQMGERYLTLLEDPVRNRAA